MISSGGSTVNEFSETFKNRNLFQENHKLIEKTMTAFLQS